MRLCYLLHNFPSNSETFVLDQIVELLRRGHDIEILADTAVPGCRHAKLTEYQMSARCSYFRPSPTRRSARLIAAVKILFSRPRTLRRQLLNLIREKRSLRDLVSTAFLTEPFLSRTPFNAMICHFGPSGLRATELRQRGIISCPFVVFFHGYDLSRFVEQHGADVYQQVFSRAARVYAVSESWKRRLQELGCPAQKLALQRMGVDLSDFSPRDDDFPRVGKARILSIARLVEKKGIEFGIRALQQLHQHEIDCEYVIAGDGPLREELERLAQRLGLSASVRFLGACNREEIISLLRDSAVLLTPSVTASDGDQEGIPVALMEAMASSVPVVASAHSGIPELLCEGKLGSLVPERDVKALTEALASVLRAARNPEKAEKLRMQRDAARKHIEEHYDIAANTRQLERDLRSILRREAS